MSAAERDPVAGLRSMIEIVGDLHETARRVVDARETEPVGRLLVEIDALAEAVRRFENIGRISRAVSVRAEPS